jgi:hypothetical protein
MVERTGWRREVTVATLTRAVEAERWRAGGMACPPGIISAMTYDVAIWNNPGRCRTGRRPKSSRGVSSGPGLATRRRG